MEMKGPCWKSLYRNSSSIGKDLISAYECIMVSIMAVSESECRYFEYMKIPKETVRGGGVIEMPGAQ